MEMTATEEKKLMARSPVMEDDLDFNQIKETAKKARQSLIVAEKPISQSELKNIPLYINDMVRYIKRYAAQGKNTFEYDCGKLSKACFFELANQFKHKYKEFFVVTNSKTQILIIDWSGKSEV
jgi:hypothetical protein